MPAKNTCTIRVQTKVAEQLQQFIEDTGMFTQTHIASAAITQWLETEGVRYKEIVRGGS